MPAFGSVLAPVRTSVPIEINDPPGFLMPETFGDEWWVGINGWYSNQIVPSSVTKAESVLINPLVRMPWVVIDSTGARIEPWQPGYPIWLLDPMMLNGSSGGPNTGALPMMDRVDRFDFWARWLRDAMRYGIGLLACGMDSRGQPLAGTLDGLSPFRLLRDERDGWSLANPDGTVQPIDEDGYAGGRRLVVLRHSLPGGIFGRHREELALAMRGRRYSAEALDSNTPSGVITTDQPINQKQADGARTEWESRLKRRTIAVLGNGSKYQQVVMSPVDAEIVSLLQASDRQVAHMYELSAWELDAPTGDPMTYANLGEKRQDRVDGPLASWSARLEETLGSLLPWGWRMQIDFSHYTKQIGPEVSGNAAPDPAGSI